MTFVGFQHDDERGFVLPASDSFLIYEGDVEGHCGLDNFQARPARFLVLIIFVTCEETVMYVCSWSELFVSTGKNEGIALAGILKVKEKSIPPNAILLGRGPLQPPGTKC